MDTKLKIIAALVWLSEIQRLEAEIKTDQATLDAKRRRLEEYHAQAETNYGDVIAKLKSLGDFDGIEALIRKPDQLIFFLYNIMDMPEAQP